MALNGGPAFRFTPAISFVVNCRNQAEVDHYWDRLVEGGEPSQCGWLTDRFGVSWQIVPERLGELMRDPDAARANRVVQAMLKMVKLDVAELEAAAKRDELERCRPQAEEPAGAGQAWSWTRRTSRSEACPP